MKSGFFLLCGLLFFVATFLLQVACVLHSEIQFCTYGILAKISLFFCVLFFILAFVFDKES